MNRRRAGYTLIEIMVVVALVAIMASIAVPSFTTFISNYRTTAAINDVLQAVTQTRSESLKRGRKMILLPRDGAASSITTYSNAGSWINGWAVFQYDCSLGLQTYNALSTTNIPIALHASLPSSIVVSGAGTAVPFNGLNYLSFDGSGYPRTASTSCSTPITNLPVAQANNGILMTNTNGSSVTVRTLCVAIMGRARIVTSADVCATG